MTNQTKLCFELLATISLSYSKLYNAIFRAPPRQVWTVLLNRSEPCIRRLTSRSGPCIRRLTSRYGPCIRRLTSRSKPCEDRSARRAVHRPHHEYSQHRASEPSIFADKEIVAARKQAHSLRILEDKGSPLVQAPPFLHHPIVRPFPLHVRR